jgi:hypothetical protein
MTRDKSFFRRLGWIVALSALAAVLAGVPIEAGEPLFAGYGASSRGAVDEPMRARNATSLNLDFTIPNDFIDQILGPGAQTQVECILTAKNGGAPQSGVRVKASGSVAVTGFPPTNFGPVNGRTNRQGVYGATFVLAVPGPVGSPIVVEAAFDLSGNRRITSWDASCSGLVNGN